MRLTGPAVLAAALTLSVGCPLAAYAETSPSSSATVVITDDHSDSDGLSDAELQRQIARAEALRSEIAGSNSRIAAAMTTVDEASDKANAALEAFSIASAEARDRREAARTQAEIAKNLQERLDKARQDLREWAVDAYTQGGPLAEELSVLDALTDEASKVSDPLNDLSYITDNRIRSVEDIREVAVAQRIASMNSQAELRKALAAEKKAAAAKKQAQANVEAQQDALADLRAAHQDQIAEAGPLAGLLLGTGDQDAVATSERLMAALEVANVTVKDLRVTPCTDKTGTFPNGQIPPSNLCPMVGSSDELLVPDAAAAFNAMSRAYARDTGSLICVTDGYRSYAGQVAVKALRGPWAATPGSSVHGLGRAVDLCGGVQDYSAPAHLWLVQNAAVYGWFHPSWAAAGGKLPEPWHWEFAG